MRDRTVSRLQRRFRELERERTSWETGWFSIQENILPRRGRFLERGTLNRNDGTRKGTSLLDDTALQANDRCAAGLLTGLTTPSRPWVQDKLRDPDFKVDGEVQRWLDRLTQVKMMIFQQMDVYTALYDLYLEAAGFGTFAALLFKDDETIARIYPLTIGEYWLGTDHRGEHHELMYRSTMTAEQIALEFASEGGELSEKLVKKLPISVRNALTGGNEYAEFNVLCYLGRNDGGGVAAQRGKPWICEYWIEGGVGSTGSLDESAASDERFLRRSGYSYKPFVSGVWQKIGRDAYGRGCGHNALGDASMLQRMEKLSLRGVEYMVNPPLQGPAWAHDRDTDLRPGAYHPVRTGEGDLVRSLWEVRMDIGALDSKVERIQNRVREAFYNDVLATFMTRQPTTITATEATEISQEKLTLFAPIAVRFLTSLLIPLNEAVIQMMTDYGLFDADEESGVQGLVGPPPAAIEDQDLDYNFTGVLAQASNLVRAGSIERVIGMGLQLAQLKKLGVEEIDFEYTLREYVETVAAPPGMVPSQAELEAKRAEAAQMAQMAQAGQMATAAKDGSAAVKNLADSRAAAEGEGSSVLEGLDQLLAQGQA